MAVTRITYTFGTPRKPRPRIGDTKVIRGVLHVRRQMLTRPWPGAKLHGLVSNGRPVCEWAPVDKDQP